MPKIIVVRPDITEQERGRRVKEFEDTLSGLLRCSVSVKLKSLPPRNYQQLHMHTLNESEKKHL